MNTTSLLLTVLALTLIPLHTADAQCEFNSGTLNTKLKVGMVRSYANCPSTEHTSVGATTRDGTPACTPVTAAQGEFSASSYSFAPTGSYCRIEFIAGVPADCSTYVAGSWFNGPSLNLAPGPCHLVRVKASCKGILNSSNQRITLPLDDGFQLATLMRWTTNDPENEDMTVIDFPVSYQLDVTAAGKLFTDTSLTEALVPLIGENNAALPRCTTTQLLKAQIKDPTGRLFAEMGVSSR